MVTCWADGRQLEKKLTLHDKEMVEITLKTANWLEFNLGRNQYQRSV